MFIFITILLVILTILEGTVTTLPLVLVFLLLLAIHRRDEIVFILAFTFGVVLDILRLQTIGGTSLFLLCFLFLILLYEHKYETSSLPFVVIASFLGSAGFLIIFGSQNVLIQAVASSMIAAIVFIFGRLGRLGISGSLKF